MAAFPTHKENVRHVVKLENQRTERKEQDMAEAEASMTYQQKAVEKARKHWEKQKHKAIHEREPFYGLQIQPSSSFYDESEGRKPGDKNLVGFGFDLHPWVTFVAGGLILVFIALTLIFQEQASTAFSETLNFFGSTFGWLYILATNIFIIFLVVLAFSKYGKIRIGGPDSVPEFSTFAWFAMLLSAGMGIGLMFWSVAEPLFHFDGPPPLFDITGGTPAAAQISMGVTYFHWGIHPWAVYALVSLSLAFFAYNRGLPLTIRSIFYPLLGEKIYGFWGNLIDILSVLATLFGLATSLGLGVQQVTAGLNFLFEWPTATWFQVTLIAVITGFATMSVMAGLDKGVKNLSTLNMYLAAAFMVFILIVGPTVFILNAFTQNLGYYAQNFLQMSFWVETFYGAGEEGTNWQSSWTIFYWGWWISWSPFVGMFIARVSRGRTLREFVFGVMLIPTLLSFLWMSVFGSSGLWLQATGAADLVAAVNDDVATALFVMLENFPLTIVTSLIGVFLVVVFFVTSSDSGSLVVDHLTSGGKLDSPVPQRIFWAVTEGVIAAVLLIGGGLTALQTAAITTGLPFVIVLLIMCYSLYKALGEELYHAEILEAMTEPETQTYHIPEPLPGPAE
jgi:choline/glycine/proline betaine transport protein